MTRSFVVRLAAGAALSLAVGIALPARAATILEYDFRTAPNGSHELTGTSSVAGASTTAQIVDHNGDGSGAYPTVNTSLAMGPGFVDPVKYGSIAYNGAISGSGDGIVTKNTAVTGHNNFWVDYFGAGNGYGTGSAIMVFKPKTANHEGRGVFMSCAIGDYGSMKLYDGNSSLNNGPRLDMNGVVGVNVGNVGNWDTTAWYVLAASWKSGGSAYIYLQKLSPGGSLFSGSGGTPATVLAAPGATYLSHPIAFNSPSNATGYYNLSAESTYPFFTPIAPSETFNGDFALYRLTDQYLDSTAKFSEVYAAFVP
jgi:hypothetical protein